MSASARYATPRRPDRLTYGPQVARVAAVLGKPLMPWQQQVADVALEVDPDTGRLAYRRVHVSVPRRAGKSQLLLAMFLWRLDNWRQQRLWYTSVNGQSVSKLWRQDWSQQVATSKARDVFRFRASQGNEEFQHLKNASFVTAFAPRKESLHSQAGDVVVFDECWAFDPQTGADLLQAAGPLLMTRPEGQLWFVSAAGDATSEWWHGIVERGRLATDVDLGHGTCHFEWTAADDDRARDDPALWEATHPAVGHTIRLEDLADERAATPELFDRQYLNIADMTANDGTNPLDSDRWLSQTVDAGDRTDTMALAVDCTPELSFTSIVAAYDSGRVVELVERGPGHRWAIDRLVSLYDRYPVATVALDAAGPAGALIAPLEAAAVPVRAAAVREHAAASAQLAAAVATGDLFNVAAIELDDAALAGRRRTVGDGAWTWSRRDSDVDVSPLIAAALARWAHPDVHGSYTAIQ